MFYFKRRIFNFHKKKFALLLTSTVLGRQHTIPVCKLSDRIIAVNIRCKIQVTTLKRKYESSSTQLSILNCKKNLSHV